MPVTIPDHRFFWNRDDSSRFRDASVVADLCVRLARIGLTPDEAIELLAAIGRIELERQNASVGGVPCRRLLELARMWGVKSNGEGQ